MKIARIEAIPVALPYGHGAPKPRLGMGPVRETMDALLVRVETDGGVTGWGEAFGFATTPVTLAAIREALAPLAIGRDPADIAALTTDLRRRLQNMMQAGPARFALSGLDIALWDIAGKVAGRPVWALLGGAPRERVPAYASLLRVDTPELAASLAGAAAARGYRHVKLHQRTADTVAAARAALGPDIDLMVDANCAWGLEEAIAMARDLRPFDLTWLEEPVFPPDDYDALAALRREGAVAVAAGENLGNPNDARWMLRAGAVDVVQPSVARLGGIAAVWETVGLARAAGTRCVPHAPFVGPALIATIHIVAAMGEEGLLEHRFCDLGASLHGDAVLAREGFLAVPDGPGLGVEVDEGVIARFRMD
jgi:L-alanine-DL-glutamate epimerase-like enolase superfamily enzyme